MVVLKLTWSMCGHTRSGVDLLPFSTMCSDNVILFTCCSVDRVRCISETNLSLPSIHWPFPKDK